MGWIKTQWTKPLALSRWRHGFESRWGCSKFPGQMVPWPGARFAFAHLSDHLWAGVDGRRVRITADDMGNARFRCLRQQRVATVVLVGRGGFVRPAVRQLGVETVSGPGSTNRIPGGRFRQFILEDEWVDVSEEGIKNFGKGIGELSPVSGGLATGYSGSGRVQRTPPAPAGAR